MTIICGTIIALLLAFWLLKLDARITDLESVINPDDFWFGVPEWESIPTHVDEFGQTHYTHVPTTTVTRQGVTFTTTTPFDWEREGVEE